MLKEGSIFNAFMLTKLVSRTPISELYQAIQVESGDRYLLKLAAPDWHLTLSDAKIAGFEIGKGRAATWNPDPADILRRETALLQEAAHKNLSLPKPVMSGESDGVSYTAYEFFDGDTLQTHIQNRLKFNTLAIGTALREVSRLHAAGLFHGNLQPSTILISEDRVLLLDTTAGNCDLSKTDKETVVRCITSPQYYPLLDPRQDSMALGMLLYYFFTQRHPTIEPATISGAPPRRRFDAELQDFIDVARQHGAARYLSPLESYLNPSQFRPRIGSDTEELINKTIGLQRINIGQPDECVAAAKGSWLEFWLSPLSVDPGNIWTLDHAADVFRDIVESKMRERGRPVTEPAERAS